MRLSSQFGEGAAQNHSIATRVEELIHAHGRAESSDAQKPAKKACQLVQRMPANTGDGTFK
jgi:hypothetical protein